MRSMAGILLGLAVFLGMASSAFAEGWVNPDSSIDVEGVWASPSLGYDGNTSTYASDTSNRAGYGGYLEIDLNNAITCGRLRINADFGYNIVNSVQIDVFKDGVGWSNVFDGAISDAAYSEITFTPGQVTKARFRYHYLTAGYYFWLYEFSFYASPEFIIDPSVLTKNPTDVEQTTAGLHGKILDDGGAPCEVRFQYGIDTNYGTDTAWTGSLTATITDTTAAREVRYRTQGIGDPNQDLNDEDVNIDDGWKTKSHEKYTGQLKLQKTQQQAANFGAIAVDGNKLAAANPVVFNEDTFPIWRYWDVKKDLTNNDKSGWV